jgi:ABC-type polysaccharide/polyol phosphate transport system ATPase subunit
MRARLGFAIATAIRPDILLIDEVLAVGDAEFKEQSKRRIHDMMTKAGTVLLASHSLQLLPQVCTRAILVEKGRITMSGHPDEVISRYMGDPPSARKRPVAVRG